MISVFFKKGLIFNKWCAKRKTCFNTGKKLQRNIIGFDINKDRIDELNDYKENTIYVVCRSGNRSGFGKDILNKNNFTAINVDGGMLDWKTDKNER